MECSGLRDPVVAADAPGKFGQLGVEFVDVVLGPTRDLTISRDAELVEHSFEHRTDPDNQLEIIRRARCTEQRRWRLVFEIDDELTIARGFGTCLRQLTEQMTAVGCEVVKVCLCRTRTREVAPNGSCFGFVTSDSVRATERVTDDQSGDDGKEGEGD